MTVLSRTVCIFPDRKTDNPNEPWFLAKDVYEILELKNPATSIALLDDDEKSYIHRVDVGLSPGRDMVIVNEPGVYSLILRSRVPAAKEFKRWVTHEVLPSIRRN